MVAVGCSRAAEFVIVHVQGSSYRAWERSIHAKTRACLTLEQRVKGTSSRHCGAREIVT